MEKVYKAFSRLVNCGYSIIFMLFCIYMIFFQGNHISVIVTNPVRLVLFSALFGAVCYGWTKLLEKIGGTKANILRIAFYTVMFLGQVWFFYKTSVPFGFDTEPIRWNAINGFSIEGAEAGISDLRYFAYCPNNLFTALILRGYILATSFLKFIPPVRRITLFNVFLVDMSVVFICYCAFKVCGQMACDIRGFIGVFLYCMHPWTAVFYTDTLGGFFVSAMLAMMVWAHYTDRKAVKLSMCVAIGFMVVCGAYVKPTITIIFIAFALSYFVKNGLEKVDFKNCLVFVISAGMAFVMVQAVCRSPRAMIREYVTDIKGARGFLSFFETGLADYQHGSWNLEVNDWHIAHVDDEDYVEVSKERIKNRFIDYGISGLLSHWYGKIIWDGTDGTFSYGQEGGFYRETHSEQSTLRGRLQNYIYRDNDLWQSFVTPYLQSLWLLVCAISCASVFSKNRDKFFIFMAKVSIGGLFIFQMLFENRARYIFLYVPVMIFIAACSVAKSNKTE